MDRHDNLIDEPKPLKRSVLPLLAVALASSSSFFGDYYGPEARQRGRAQHLLERAPDALLDAKAAEKRERRRLRNIRISGVSPANEQCPRLSPDHG